MAPRTNAKRSRRSGSVRGAAAGDVITVQNVGAGAAVAAGRHAKASVTVASSRSINEWAARVHKEVDALPNTSQGEKDDIKQQVDKIKEETEKGSKAEPGRLERLLNSLGAMAPDIFDVAVTTLASPLAGIGLVARKIGEKAKVEQAVAGK